MQSSRSVHSCHPVPVNLKRLVTWNLPVHFDCNQMYAVHQVSKRQYMNILWRVKNTRIDDRPEKLTGLLNRRKGLGLVINKFENLIKTGHYKNALGYSGNIVENKPMSGILKHIVQN